MEPKISNAVSPSRVYFNDTVELSFSLSTTWIQMLTLSIDNMCNGSLYHIPGKCSDVYSTTRVCYEADFVSLPVYLLPGSTIHFSLTDVDPQVTIWVIWKSDLFDQDFSDIACEDSPRGTWCFQPKPNASQQEMQFNVTKTSYYMIYYPIGTWGITIHYHICTFNTTSLKAKYSRQTISSEPISVDISYAPFTFHETCLILQVGYIAHVCTTYGGSLSAEVQRRQDIVAFPALLTGFSVLALIALISAHVVTVRKKRTEVRYRALSNLSSASTASV